jgi:amino acid permease
VDINQVRYIGALFVIGSIVGAVICFIPLTWSGVQWAFAKKDKAKRARAKRRILWSLIGLVAIFVAFFIYNIILGLFVDTVVEF